MAYLFTGCRCLIAIIFLVSTVSKLRSRRSRADFVAATARFAPAWLLRVAAPGANPTPTGAVRLSVGAVRLSVGVVAAEIAVPALLTVPATARLGFVLAAVLLIGFTAVIWAAVAHGTRAACACFGPSTTPVGVPHIVRNLTLVAFASVGFAAPTSYQQAAPGVLLSMVAAAVAATVVAATDDLVELFR